MKQTSSSGLTGPDLREGAEAAHASGLRPADWGEGAAAEQGRPASAARPGQDRLDAVIARIGETTRRRAPAPDRPAGRTREAEDAARTAAALGSIANWIETAEDRLSESARAATEREEQLAAALTEALAVLKSRMEGVERRVQDGQAKTSAALGETLDALKGQLAHVERRVEKGNAQTSAAVADAILALKGQLDTVEHRVGTETARTSASLTDALATLKGQLEHVERKVETDSARMSATLAEALVTLKGQLDQVERRVEDDHARTSASLSDALAALKGQLESVERRMEHDKARTAASLAEALTSLKRQLNGFESRIETGEAQASATLSQALTTVKGRLDGVDARVEARHAEVSDALAAALKAVKSRIDGMETRVDAERATLSTALAGMAATMRDDLAGLAQRLERPDPAPALALIGRDVARLQGSLKDLATRDEVSAIERGLRTLADDLLNSRSGDQVAALAGSVADLHAQLRALPRETMEEVHRGLAGDIADLAERIERVSGGVDRTGLAALDGQMADLRQALDRALDPRRIDGLSAEVAGLAREIAAIRLRQVDPAEFGTLRGALEEIRAGMRRAEEATQASLVPDQLDAVSRRLDVLMSRPEPQPVDFDPVTRQIAVLAEQVTGMGAGQAGPVESLAGEIGRLSDRMDALAAAQAGPVSALTSGMERLSDQVAAMTAAQASPVEALSDEVRLLADRVATAPEGLAARFDRLEETVQQISQTSDTANLELLLRAVNDKLDQGAGAISLDALEDRLEQVRQRVARDVAEPVQAALAETLSQVKTLRSEAAIIAERAAKSALKDGQGSAPSDIEVLRQGFAELKALQASAEKRTQATLKAVHNALETLVMRIPAGPAMESSLTSSLASTVVPPVEDPLDPAAALRLEAAVRKLHKAATSHAEEIAAASKATDPAPEPEEVLLEPGSPRPHVFPTAALVAEPQGDPGAVRANFIAAARRAAQAAAAEAPVRAVPDQPAGEEPKAAISNQTLIERIRQTFDSHRRPLLLSVALLLLAAGSAQIAHLRTPKADPIAAAPPAPRINVAAASAPDVDPALLLPPTTGSLAPSAFTPGVAMPKRAAIEGIPLPAALPPSLQAAMTGDPAAIHEVAARLMDGRGLPRDAGLGAKLFEKAAEAGLVPSQFRIGHANEKGTGVPRDIAKAKAWYERAARAGHVQAMHNVAVLLADGTGGQPDYPAAARWFGEAAERGLRDSQYNLGVLLARGLGVKQDLVQSYTWFALAAAQGDADAGTKRDEVAVRLTPADLATAKGNVGGWKARAIDPGANEVPPAAQGVSALSGRRAV